MTLGVVAGLFLLSLSASALQEVTDSSLVLDDKILKSSRWIMVRIHKIGEGEARFQFGKNLPDETPKVVLTQGPGAYQIDYYKSDAISFTSNSYKHLGSKNIRNTDPRDLLFVAPSLNIQSDHSDIVQLAKEITRDARTDREKALAIHDWLTENITYDIEGVRTHSYVNSPQDAVSVLHRKLTVCMGYSNLNAALNRSLGIKTKVVTGKLIGHLDKDLSPAEVCGTPRPDHAWNEIWIDNRWIVDDSTLDSGSEDGFTGTFRRTPKRHHLFDPDPKRFAMTHVKCSEDLH